MMVGEDQVYNRKNKKYGFLAVVAILLFIGKIIIT